MMLFSYLSGMPTRLMAPGEGMRVSSELACVLGGTALGFAIFDVHPLQERSRTALAQVLGGGCAWALI